MTPILLHVLNCLSTDKNELNQLPTADPASFMTRMRQLPRQSGARLFVGSPGPFCSHANRRGYFIGCAQVGSSRSRYMLSYLESNPCITDHPGCSFTVAYRVQASVSLEPGPARARLMQTLKLLSCSNLGPSTCRGTSPHCCVALQSTLTATQCFCWGVVGVCIVCKCNSVHRDQRQSHQRQSQKSIPTLCIAAALLFQCYNVGECNRVILTACSCSVVVMVILCVQLVDIFCSCCAVGCCADYLMYCSAVSL
jgi:hypothetical protein